MNWSRRDFLRTTAASVPLFLAWNLASGVSLRTLRFGVCADLHQDVIHDGEDRLRRFIDFAGREQMDFIMQLGDFCRPYESNRQLLSIWEQFQRPRYHVLGNHDSDGGFKWSQVMAFWKMPRRYYSFDQGGWHFVVLDGNEVKPGKRPPGYPRYIGPEQQAWLQTDLQKTDAPTLIFSHQSLEDSEGVENRAEIRSILEQANRAAGWPKVGACFSGHHHIDCATQLGGIHFVQINSMSYQWLGEKFQHVRYNAGVDKSHPHLKYTAPYKEALFAAVALSAEGIQITGRRTEFVGPSPWDLGYAEVPGTSRIKERMVPWISSRQLKMQTGGGSKP